MRNIDVAAHKAVFEDDFCQKFALPDAAEKLTERTIAALNSLLHHLSPRDSRPDVITESDRDRLIEAFKCALKLRLSMVTGKDEYLCSLWSSATPYNDGLMDLAQESVIPGGTRADYQGATVKFTIVPGLIRVKSDMRDIGYDGLPCVIGSPEKRMICLTRAKVLLGQQRS